jgi:hypothetical protein
VTPQLTITAAQATEALLLAHRLLDTGEVDAFTVTLPSILDPARTYHFFHEDHGMGDVVETTDQGEVCCPDLWPPVDANTAVFLVPAQDAPPNAREAALMLIVQQVELKRAGDHTDHTAGNAYRWVLSGPVTFAVHSERTGLQLTRLAEQQDDLTRQLGKDAARLRRIEARLNLYRTTQAAVDRIQPQAEAES